MSGTLYSSLEMLELVGNNTAPTALLDISHADSLQYVHPYHSAS